MIPLYVIGGLLAVGMTIVDLLSVFKEDLNYAMGFSEKLKTLCFQLVQSLFFILLAFAFSWLAVGFIYIKNKRR